jgi:hypothetical protein
MDFYEVPELSVAIGSNGEPVYVEAFGFADRENQERLTPQHLFRIASVTNRVLKNSFPPQFDSVPDSVGFHCVHGFDLTRRTFSTAC